MRNRIFGWTFGPSSLRSTGNALVSLSHYFPKREHHQLSIFVTQLTFVWLQTNTHSLTSMLNLQYLFVTCLVVLCLLRLQYKTMWTKIPNWSLFMSNKTHFAVQMNLWLFLFFRRCLSFDLQNRIYILQERQRKKRKT